MPRFLFAFFLLFLTVPVIAQKLPAPAKNAEAARTADKLATETVRADKAERDLVIREAMIELQSAQTDQAYNRFEIEAAFLSILITFLVLWFGFKTEKAAAVAAAAAAREELAKAKGQIDALLAEANTATAAANTARAEAEAVKAEVEQMRQQAADALAQAKANAEQATRHADMAREAAAIIDNVRTNTDTNREAARLTPDQAAKVEEAAKGIDDKPEAAWSVEDFKTRIGKARYLDSDWRETLRLAQKMATIHHSDDHAVIFARIAECHALYRLFRHQEAIVASDAAIKRCGKVPDVETERSLIWAMHLKGICLTNIGRPADAEAMLRELLSLRERVDGPEHSGTLATRHELARAVLDQGRAADAEALFRELLPLCKRVNGQEHPNTLMTRQVFARAVLDQGRAADANALFQELLPLCERINGHDHLNTLIARYGLAAANLQNGDPQAALTLLESIPHSPRNPDWEERLSANLAFIRGQVADALGKREEAGEWLKRAAGNYAAAYPADHHYRRVFDAYNAGR